MHQEVSLLEAREQGLPEPGIDHGAGEHDDGDGDIRRARGANDPGEQHLVPPLQPAHERGLTALDRCCAQKHQGQRRGDGQGDHHRGQHGECIGEGQGLEEGARQAFHEEDRYQRHRHDQRRVDDGASNLERGLENDGGRRLAAPLSAMLTQPPHDVLDVDDGVVDDDPDGDHEPGQDHGVDGGAAHVEYEGSRDQRQGDGDHADQRGPPLEEKRAEHHDHEQAPDQQGGGEILERQLDEGRGPKDLGVDLDPGKTGLQRRQGLVHPARHVQGVGPWQLLDDHHEARTTIDDRVPDHRPGIPLHLGHLPQEHGLTVVALERNLGQVLRLEDRQDVAEGEPLIGSVDESLGLQLRVLGIGEGRELESFADRLLDVAERQVVHPQQLRVDQHRQQLDSLAPDRHVGDARNLHQAELDRPVRRHREIDQVVLFRGNPDLHGAAGR